MDHLYHIDFIDHTTSSNEKILHIVSKYSFVTPVMITLGVGKVYATFEEKKTKH